MELTFIESLIFSHVAILAEDIDELLMAFSPDYKELYFLKPPRNNVLQRVYLTKINLNQFVDIKKSIPSLFMLIRAFTGCVTTTAFNRKGKNQFVNIFKDDYKLRAAAKTFLVENQSEEVLFNEEVFCILVLYGAKNAKSLNELRSKRFITLALKNKSVQLQLGHFLRQKMQLNNISKEYIYKFSNGKIILQYPPNNEVDKEKII